MYLLRKLVTLGLFVALLASQHANAFGLGEITLKSALNQPLHAEIRLLNIRDLSANDIIINLASTEDFERAGVERLMFYSDLQFQVVTQGPDAPIVRVTTRAPVREPYLNFLIEARWASGRLLREYTLLMDLPTFADEPASPVEAPRQRPATTPRPAVAPSPAEPRPRTQPPRPAAETPAPGIRGDTYTVNANDTLWEIAQRVRPNSGVTIQQTMLALQRQNPDAFINGNINLLRRGQILEIPSLEEIRALNNTQAISQVAAQNREWSERATGAQLDAGRRDVVERRQPQEASGQLRLATPSPAEGAVAGLGTGGEGDPALAGELAAAQEELEKTRRENTELSSRVRDLEEQIETMERLINVSNEQLRALQMAAAAERPTGERPEVEQPAELEAVDPTLPEEAIEQPANDAPVTTEPEAVEEEVVAPEPSEPIVATPPVREAPQVVRTPRPKTVMDHIEDNLIAIALALIALLAGIWYLIHRRNADDDFGDDDGEYDDDMAMQLAAGDEDFSFDEMDVEDEETTSLLDEEPLEQEEFASADLEEELSTDAETGDVVGEADIYIAYGKLDQAEEMLLKGLAREPASTAIRLKLLEVYLEQQNPQAFDEHYAALLSSGDQGAISRAGELRSDLPGAGEFDTSLLTHTTTPQAAPSAKPAADDDFSFDLDQESADTGLDFSLDETSSEDTISDDELGSLDFDLGDDDDLSLDLEESLAAEAPLVSDKSEMQAGGTRFDMSFDETSGESEAEDDMSFDFDLGDDASEAASSDLNFEADEEFSLEDLEADDGISVEKPQALDTESDDFSFELDDLELEGADAVETDELEFSLADDEEPEATTTLKPTDAGQDDDFDLERAVGDLDLAALDEEMAALDADLGVDETASVPKAKAPVEDEFSLDDLDEAPAPVASKPTADSDDDDMFEEALSGLTGKDASTAEALAADLSDEDMDAEMDFLADSDEAATKLDLARAYIDMGDSEGARDILSEVSEEGNEEQRKEAEELLSRIES